MDEAEPQTDTTPRFAADTFSGSRFLFWSLSPMLALAIVAALMGIGDKSAGAAAATVVWIATCAAMILALYNPRRFGWAVRMVTGAVFLACAAYLVDEVFLSGKPIAPTRRSEASPWNSIHAFVLFGLPSFWLTVRGLRRPTAAAPDCHGAGPDARGANAASTSVSAASPREPEAPAHGARARGAERERTLR